MDTTRCCCYLTIVLLVIFNVYLLKIINTIENQQTGDNTVYPEPVQQKLEKMIKDSGKISEMKKCTKDQEILVRKNQNLKHKLDRIEKTPVLPFCDELFYTQILKNTSFTTRIKPDPLKFRPNATELHEYALKTGIVNGCWSPKYCKTNQKLAVIVPYRDRPTHKLAFLLHMHKFLQAQHREYCIVLSEQVDKGQFNRGKLMNTGFDFAVKNLKFWKDKNEKPNCFVFSDVDLLPEDLRNLYGCFGYKANHLCDKFDKYNYKTQFLAGHRFSSGGVVSVGLNQYKFVNGHPNRYFGWGWEDHDGAERFRNYNSSVDELIDRNLDRGNHFMEKYILGSTEDGGGFGMSRANKYGYYTQLRHSHQSWVGTTIQPGAKR